jgi:hypothetical protein
LCADHEKTAFFNGLLGKNIVRLQRSAITRAGVGSKNISGVFLNYEFSNFLNSRMTSGNQAAHETPPFRRQSQVAA